MYGCTVPLDLAIMTFEANCGFGSFRNILSIVPTQLFCSQYIMIRISKREMFLSAWQGCNNTGYIPSLIMLYKIDYFV